MKESTIPGLQSSKETKSKPYWLLLVLLAVALFILAIFAYPTWRDRQATNAQAALLSQQEEAQAAIAEITGVTISKIIVTADGGLVDLRYLVVDPDKAEFLFEDLEKVPKMYAEPNGPEVALHDLPHRHGLQAGLQYSLLYLNPQGSVKPGGYVTVKVSDIALERFKVEGQ
jgi:hypothetical protein